MAKSSNTHRQVENPNPIYKMEGMNEKNTSDSNLFGLTSNGKHFTLPGSKIKQFLKAFMASGGVEEYVGSKIVTIGRERERINISLYFDITNEKDSGPEMLIDISGKEIPPHIYHKIKFLFARDQYDTKIKDLYIKGQKRKCAVLTLFSPVPILHMGFRLNQFFDFDVLRIYEYEDEIYINGLKREVSHKRDDDMDNDIIDDIDKAFRSKK